MQNLFPGQVSTYGVFVFPCPFGYTSDFRGNCQRTARLSPCQGQDCPSLSLEEIKVIFGTGPQVVKGNALSDRVTGVNVNVDEETGRGSKPFFMGMNTSLVLERPEVDLSHYQHCFQFHRALKF